MKSTGISATAIHARESQMPAGAVWVGRWPCVALLTAHLSLCSSIVRHGLLSMASRNCPVAVMKTARWWPWDLPSRGHQRRSVRCGACLLYTSDAADDLTRVD